MQNHNKKPKTTNYSPENLYQATVYAWGVNPIGASKLKHQINVKLFGGNVGHASIGVCFPADKRGAELIHKYCESDKQQIPYRKITKLNKISNGETTKTSYYEVYFSAWPGSEYTPMSLQTMLDDKIEERAGIHHDYRRNVPSVLGMTDYSDADIDRRTIKGLLGIKKHITLPPLIVIYEASHAEHIISLIEQFKKIDLEIKNNNNDIKQLKLDCKNLIRIKPLDEKTKKFLLNKKSDILKKENNISILKGEFIELYKKNTQYNLNNYMKITKTIDGQHVVKFVELEHIKAILEKFKELDISIRNHSNDIYKLRLEHVKLIKSLQLDRETKQVLLNPTKDTSKKNEGLSLLEEKIKQDISKKEDVMSRLEGEFRELYEKNSLYNLDRYIKIGKPADGQCSLPIVDCLNKEHDHKSGLELEEMLKTMRYIADDQEEFKLYKKNCSSTVLTILNSGIRKQDRKWMAKHVPKVKQYYDKSAWIFKMLTPQSVYNAAATIEKRIMRKEGITRPIQALIKKPTPIKKIMKGLKFLKTLFINRNKAHKLVSKAEKDMLKKEEPSLFLGFSQGLQKTNHTDKKLRIKPRSAVSSRKTA